MLIFLALSVILTIICLLILVPALFNRRKLVVTDLQEENLTIARQRLAEIDSADASADEARVELEAALIDDLDGPTYAISSDKSVGRWPAIVVLTLIPLTAGLLYMQLGNHSWNKQIALPSAEEIQADPAKGIELLLARLEQVLAEQPDDASRVGTCRTDLYGHAAVFQGRASLCQSSRIVGRASRHVDCLG